MFDTRKTLLRRARDLGDRQSWNEFHAIYRPLIFGYLRSWGIKEHDANDLTQTVFLLLMAKLPTFELDWGRGRFRGYLWSMAHNAWVAEIRGKSVRDRAEEEWWRQSGQADESESPRFTEITDLGRTRRKILRAALRQARAEASETAWKCFVERVVHRRPVKEIAIDLGIAASTVSTRSSEVMKDVKRLCAEIGGV